MSTNKNQRITIYLFIHSCIHSFLLSFIHSFIWRKIGGWGHRGRRKEREEREMSEDDGWKRKDKGDWIQKSKREAGKKRGEEGRKREGRVKQREKRGEQREEEGRRKAKERKRKERGCNKSESEKKVPCLLNWALCSEWRGWLIGWILTTSYNELPKSLSTNSKNSLQREKNVDG